MTFEERNHTIKEAVFTRLFIKYEQYTSSSRILSDAEWENYINSMNKIAEFYKNENMGELIADLTMAFLNDTERVQKKLKKVKA